MIFKTPYNLSEYLYQTYNLNPFTLETLSDMVWLSLSGSVKLKELELEVIWNTDEKDYLEVKFDNKS